MTDMERRVSQPAVPANPNGGQATWIEQSRAVAQVQAAYVVAQQRPRDMVRAKRAMEQACQIPELAEQAFYAVKRGDNVATGPSIHLARELARMWGNLDYGVYELRRDAGAGQSEIKAYCTDLETNVTAAHIFIVPHVRKTKTGTYPLTDPAQVYENNANAGARRLREQIFATLPRWYTEAAQQLCRKTKTAQVGADLPGQTERLIAEYARGRNPVTVAELEAKVGRARAQWTADDVAELGVILASLKKREITREQAFPTEAPTVYELVGDADPDNDTSQGGEPDDPWSDTEVRMPGGGA